MKAMILAAGLGTRLRPLTVNIPKPMMPVVNIPVLEYSIELLKSHGVDTIVINLYHHPDVVRDYFGDGRRWDLRVYYSEEEQPLGDAGGVKHAERFFDETFIVMNGDLLINANLTEALAFHTYHNAQVTIILTDVGKAYNDTASLSHYGVVVADDTGRVIQFQQKPDAEEALSNVVSPGIYILEPGVLDLIPNNQPCFFGDDLFPSLLERKVPFGGMQCKSFWHDVKTLPRYRQAHYALLNGQIKHHMTYGKEIGSRIWVGEGSTIHPQARIDGPVVIGKNSRVEKGCLICRNTVLGNEVKVMEGAHLSAGIVWDGSYIGENVVLDKCIVGKDCTITSIKMPIIEAVIADNCIIGPNVIIHPNVLIWPNKILRDCKVSTDVI